MRAAPIALVYSSQPNVALLNARLSSLPTHPYPTCLEACQLYTHLLTVILSPGPEKELSDVFRALSSFGLEDPALRTIFSKYDSLESFARTPEDQIQSSGYVLHTLEAALWAFFTTTSFAEGALKVVNLGDDADTVGAVYGGLAGAFYGFEAIPKDWVNGLERKDILDEVVEGLVKLVDGSD